MRAGARESRALPSVLDLCRAPPGSLLSIRASMGGMIAAVLRRLASVDALIRLAKSGC